MKTILHLLLPLFRLSLSFYVFTLSIRNLKKSSTVKKTLLWLNCKHAMYRKHFSASKGIQAFLKVSLIYFFTGILVLRHYSINSARKKMGLLSCRERESERLPDFRLETHYLTTSMILRFCLMGAPHFLISTQLIKFKWKMEKEIRDKKQKEKKDTLYCTDRVCLCRL